MKPKRPIKVKLVQNDKYPDLLEMLVNDHPFDFSVEERGVALYINNERGWCLRLDADGTWQLE